MAVPSSIVGSTTGPFHHEVDARWVMAYSAGLGDLNPCYLDTRRPEGVVAHPVFAVCPEWPVIVASRDAANKAGMADDEVRRGVHATHDLTVHRLARPGDVLTTTLTTVGLEQRSPGAYSTIRLETVDANGEPVSTTEQGSIYLGVDVEGENIVPVPARTPIPKSVLQPGVTHKPEIEVPIAVGAGAAHLYTECARIWNPIHTDPLVAAAAGLPGLILHGTATLAHAVSSVVDQVADGDPHRVRRIVGRFGAMVRMPSRITVKIFEPSADGNELVVPVEVMNDQGSKAVDRAAVVLELP